MGLAGASEALLRGCAAGEEAPPLADCRWGHVVREISPRPGGGWVLRGSAKGKPEGFVFEADWLVAATSSIAHPRWTTTFGGEPPLLKGAAALGVAGSDTGGGNLIVVIHTYVHAYVHTYIHTYVYKYVHTYIHTYIDIHIHTYTYTHKQTNKQT